MKNLLFLLLMTTFPTARHLPPQTYQGALARLQQAECRPHCALSLQKQTAVTSQQLTKLEGQVGRHLPQSLQELHTRQGTFTVYMVNYETDEPNHIQEKYPLLGIDDVSVLIENSPERQQQTTANRLGLVNRINERWGGKAGFEKIFTDEQIAGLNRDYTVFGDYHNAKGEHLYLYFDRHGKFGSVRFHPAKPETDIRTDFQPLLKGNPAPHTLDGLLTPCIMEIIADYAGK